MNIQNLQLLTEMLVRLGFSDQLSAQLLKSACMLADHFLISEVMTKSDDVLRYDITFQLKGANYHLKYYDASLRKKIELPDVVAELDKRMSAISWAKWMNGDGMKWDLKDADSVKLAGDIASIVNDLSKADHDLAIKLKVKHWGDILHDPFNVSALRAKFEITQRFYFFEEQGCIGAEDAYRFLQNRWMEKQMLVMRRQLQEQEDTPGDNPGTGKLLPKKRRKTSAK